METLSQVAISSLVVGISFLVGVSGVSLVRRALSKRKRSVPEGEGTDLCQPAAKRQRHDEEQVPSEQEQVLPVLEMLSEPESEIGDLEMEAQLLAADPHALDPAYRLQTAIEMEVDSILMETGYEALAGEDLGSWLHGETISVDLLTEIYTNLSLLRAESPYFHEALEAFSNSFLNLF